MLWLAIHLPALPLQLQDGFLVVAEAFTARPGGGR
jgi:hypothetical protein